MNTEIRHIFIIVYDKTSIIEKKKCSVIYVHN